jgi:hypothetical protein
MRVPEQLLDRLFAGCSCSTPKNPCSSRSSCLPHTSPHMTCPAVPCPTAGLDNYIRLMKECWAQDPKQRPSFGPIARRLKAMQHWLHACTNALHLTSTATRLQSLRQDSSTRGGGTAGVPLAVGPSLPAAVPPHIDAPAAPAATATARDTRGLVGAPGPAEPATPRTNATKGAASAPSRQDQQQTDHAVLSSDTDEVPPPVPDPAVTAAAEAAAPKPVAEPSVQVGVSLEGHRVPLRSGSLLLLPSLQFPLAQLALD